MCSLEPRDDKCKRAVSEYSISYNVKLRNDVYSRMKKHFLVVYYDIFIVLFVRLNNVFHTTKYKETFQTFHTMICDVIFIFDKVYEKKISTNNRFFLYQLLTFNHRKVHQIFQTELMCKFSLSQ